MYPSFPNWADGPRFSLYLSMPYGPTLYGVRCMRIGYCFESSFGTYTEVKSLTPSRIGMRYSYLVYPARTASLPWPSVGDEQANIAITAGASEWERDIRWILRRDSRPLYRRAVSRAFGIPDACQGGHTAGGPIARPIGRAAQRRERTCRSLATPPSARARPSRTSPSG